MIVVGLTGSIGMGKSATAALFAEEGVPVWSADEAVHRLYGEGGAAVAPIRAAFPGVIRDGTVDRAALSARLQADPSGFARLEAIVHPLVAADRTAFLTRAIEDGHAVAVLDIPLLFETGGDRLADAVVVVSAPAEVQRERVLARPGMTPEKFEAILARQLPDAEKRARADFVVDTSRGLEPAREQVRDFLGILRAADFKSRGRRLDGIGEPPQ
jgi:dephospho-CoA kinase